MSNLSNKELELRGAINILLYELTDSDDVVKELGDKFEALFTTAQQQLLTEILEQKVTGNLNAKALHTYVPVSVLEQKLKELG